MLFTHPDRSHKPVRSRAGRTDRRDPASWVGGGVGGPSGGTAAAGLGYHVGGNAFFPGGVGTATAGISSHDRQGQGDPGTGGSGLNGGAEGEVTLVEPGKVSFKKDGAVDVFRGRIDDLKMEAEPNWCSLYVDTSQMLRTSCKTCGRGQRKLQSQTPW